MKQTAKRRFDTNWLIVAYLGIFQIGLALLLGAAGLAVVLLRGIWERRSELALLRAMGYPNRALGKLVLAENGLLLVLGLAGVGWFPTLMG